jgi:autotransporter-associated beta strand protein
LILYNNETYSGATYVNNGTLALAGNASISNSATITISSSATLDASRLSSGIFSLANGQTLNGNGTVNGWVAVAPGGVVAPGASGIGMLTFNNDLLLAGTVVMKLSKDGGSSCQSDLMVVGGTLTYGGTLNVSNLGGAFAAGDRFQLFTADTYQGSFTATNLPSAGAGLVWNWNPSNGILSVVNTNAATANFKVIATGGALQFSWATDHLNWQLYTNSVGLAAIGSWFPVLGSSAVTNETITINSSSANVFFQLRYP